jgi:hypothetical protein
MAAFKSFCGLEIVAAGSAGGSGGEVSNFGLGEKREQEHKNNRNKNFIKNPQFWKLNLLGQ